MNDSPAVAPPQPRSESTLVDNNDTPRTPSASTESASTSKQETKPAETMFDPSTDAWQETRKAERKRIAMWGLATGGVMAVIMALCVLLAYLASSS